MKRTLPILICLMLVITTITLNISAKNDINPEIKDDVDDITGTLIKHPLLFKILKTIGIIPIESFEFMDITAAWFGEKETEPDYLYASLELKDFTYTPLRAIYAVRWTYNGKLYAAGLHTHSDGEFTWFFAGRMFGLLDNWAYKQGLIVDITDCMIDEQNDLITLKIPKNIIGDPQPGDILTETNAWTGLRFIFELITYPFGGEMARDTTAIGNDYIIQY